MQNALYRCSDVRGWRQPAHRPMMFRENKALLQELQHSDVQTDTQNDYSTKFEVQSFNHLCPLGMSHTHVTNTQIESPMFT